MVRDWPTVPQAPSLAADLADRRHGQRRRSKRVGSGAAIKASKACSAVMPGTFREAPR